MNQEKKHKHPPIDSNTAKEVETIRQLSRGCLYLTIGFVILIALILYLMMKPLIIGIKAEPIATAQER